MQQEAAIGDFPPGRVNVTPPAEPDQPLELHSGDQNDQSDSDAAFTPEGSESADAAASIAEMIRSSMPEEEDGQEASAEEASRVSEEEAKNTLEPGGGDAASAGEVSKYWNSVSDKKKKNSDLHAIIIEAAETGKDREAVSNYFASQTRALLNYGHEVARSNIKYGKEISPTQTVIHTVYEFADKNQKLIKDGSVENNIKRVAINREEAAGATLELTVEHLGENTGGLVEEQWIAPMLVTPDGFEGSYTKTTISADIDDFDVVKIKKSRTMTAEDAERLKEALGAQDDYELAA